MIKTLRLRNFKGFESYELSFGDENWLVGPNNAGKSTVIAALRTASQMVAHAKRRKPDYFPMDRSFQVAAHLFPAGRFGLVEENLRHEFRNVETRLEVTFSSKARLFAVWPAARLSDVEDGDDVGEEDQATEAFFYVRSATDVQIRTAAKAKELLPDIGVIPILSPVEHEESHLSDDYVRANLGTRLASRHSRNQLRLLQGQPASTEEYEHRLAEFLAWARPWTQDFEIGELVSRLTSDGYLLDVFCREATRHTESELFWVGDGTQVWIQLLLHIFRNHDRDVIVLDEPDLYLHADLQRRLVRVLETLDAQTIAASHSPEILAEAAPSSVVWVSKDRRRAVRAPSEKVANELTAAIGSQFNLRLARALRAKAVVFVEGDDMKILRNLARSIGAQRVATETNIVTVPLRGFSNWEHVEPFSWLAGGLLDQSVSILVLLDRDYRTLDQVEEVEARLRTIGVEGHVWRWKELESYLLLPSAIARKSGADSSKIRTELELLASSKKEEVFARILPERIKREAGPHRHQTEVIAAARTEFEEQWKDPSNRPTLCNAKDLMSRLNAWLQGNGAKTVSARGLSSAVMAAELPEEIANVIRRAEALAS